MTDVGTLQTVVDQQRHNCLQRRDAIRRVVPGADLIAELMPLCFALAHAGRGMSVCAAPPCMECKQASRAHRFVTLR
jgi:hypothetical protein